MACLGCPDFWFFILLIVLTKAVSSVMGMLESASRRFLMLFGPIRFEFEEPGVGTCINQMR
jgi:hypothetical protein